MRAPFISSLFRFLNGSLACRTWFLALGAVLTTAAPAAAQAVVLANAEATVGSGFSLPFGVAVDSHGNVFVADSNNAAVEEILAVNGSVPTVNATVRTLATGLYDPSSVAVDANGNVYVAGEVSVQEILAVNGSVPTSNPTIRTLYNSSSFVTGLAVDGSGDVFFSNASSGNVSEIVAVNGSIPVSNPFIRTFLTISDPEGIALDGNGNLYVATPTSIIELLAVAGSLPGDPASRTLSSGFSQANGVALDASGDVYVSDTLTNTVSEILAVNGSIPASNPVVKTLASNFNSPASLAVSTSGFVYVADTDNNRIVELQTQYVNFGNANVCAPGQTTPAPCTEQQTLTYNITAGGTLGTPRVLTQGAPNFDYTLIATTCTGAVISGAQCTVAVNFAPLAPGLRSGAVQIVDSSGNVLATTFIYGQGDGPAIAFSTGVQSTVGTGLSSPSGVAVDAAGDVFIANTEANSVVEVPAGGGPQITMGSGLRLPFDVAVDGAGNLFVADTGNNRVVEILAGTGVQTTLSSGSFNTPESVAIDGAGNVFVANTGLSQVLELPVGGGPPTTVGSGLAYPRTVAIDGLGNVVIADSANNRVVKVAIGTGVQTTLANIPSPSGVAIDAAGDVFVADINGGTLSEISVGGAVNNLLSGPAQPFGVTTNSVGDVFVADFVNNRILKLARSQPPALSFAPTSVGNTSSDSPQSISIQDIGNEPLTAAGNGIVVPSPFALVGGAGPIADCSTSFSLTPGGECNISISFIPTRVGPQQGQVFITDNALNAPNSAQQLVPLSGTGLAIVAPITFTIPNQTYGAAPFTLSASSSSPAPFVYTGISGPAKISGNQITLTGAGTVVVQASQAASGNYAANSQTASFSVAMEITPITFVVPNQTYSTTPFHVSASSLSTGAFTYSVVSGPATLTGTSITLTGIGTVVLQASQAATANFAANSQTATFTVAAATTPITFTVPNQTYGAAPFTITASSASTGGFTYTVVSGPATITGSSVSLTGAGTVVVQASQAASGNYAANAQTATFIVAAATPTITFSVPNQTYGAAPFTVNASSSSTGTFTYSILSGPATITGSTVTLTGTGTVVLSASQAAAGNYAANRQTASFTVAQAATTTTLQGSVIPNPGNTATLSATVTPQISGLPTGAVTFYNGSTLLQTVPLVNGVATYTTGSYAGSQSFTAVYNGDTNFSKSALSNTVSLLFTVAPTITFTTAANYAFGQSFQAAASSNSTGTLTYSLVSGPATVSAAGAVTVTGEGTVVLQASQAAAAGYTAASKQVSFAAIQATSTTTLSTLTVKSGAGSAASLTASVAPQFAGTPTGTVSFYDGSTKLATVALMAGKASYTTSQLTGAQHVFSAVYSGDINFTTSTSNSVTLTIAATSVRLQLAETALTYPELPAFLVRVTPAGSSEPTGTVTIYDGTKPVGTYPLYAFFEGNVAGVVQPPLGVGTHLLTAVYSGDKNYAPGQSSIVPVTVASGPVNLSLECSNTTVNVGQTLHCRVTANESFLPVTGTVTYASSTGGGGSLTLDALGHGTFTYQPAAKGSFTLKATYAAQGNYQAAQSNTVALNVNEESD